MAKLSDLVRKIDATAKSGDREKALSMLDALLKKVPDNKALLARKEKYSKELELDRRISALEEKYGA
ncbi:MAG: hypothetical protein R6U36_04295 [Candidatus Fermentibacteraceae bacterium]